MKSGRRKHLDFEVKMDEKDFVFVKRTPDEKEEKLFSLFLKERKHFTQSLKVKGKRVKNLLA